jgi:hypothetical protein
MSYQGSNNYKWHTWCTIFVPVPIFYNSFSLMRTGPAGAHRKMRFALQNPSIKKNNATVVSMNNNTRLKSIINLVLLFILTVPGVIHKNRLPMAMPWSPTAEVDRFARSAHNAADKVQSPPKHEKNVLLQSLVKHIEAEKIRKAGDCGVIASIIKERQTQYPWLKRGMLYHLMTTLDGVVTQNILHMGCYPIDRQTAAIKKSFDQQKAKPQLEWLDETFLHFVFKPEGGASDYLYWKQTTAHHHRTQSIILRQSDTWVRCPVEPRIEPWV